MKKFKFYTPYRPDGKTRFPESTNRPGVYLIKENDQVVYVGHSTTDLYKTMYRHFQTWNDRRAERVTYKHDSPTKHYTVRLVYCTASQAPRLERALIISIEPRDNLNGLKHEILTAQDARDYYTYMDTPTEREAPF